MVRCSDATSLPKSGPCYVFAVGRSNGSPFDAFNLPNESIPQAGRNSGSAFSEKSLPPRFRLPARRCSEPAPGKLPSVLHAARYILTIHIFWRAPAERARYDQQRFVSCAGVLWRTNIPGPGLHIIYEPGAAALGRKHPTVVPRLLATCA